VGIDPSINLFENRLRQQGGSVFGLWTITLIVLSLIMPGPKSDKSVRASSCHGLSRL